jgi:uncharacterized Zn-binding protein involved in type VI secretion
MWNEDKFRREFEILQISGAEGRKSSAKQGHVAQRDAAGCPVCRIKGQRVHSVLLPLRSSVFFMEIHGIAAVFRPISLPETCAVRRIQEAFRYSGEAVASGGEPVASGGEPVASSGEPVASSGEPVASSGEAIASSGEAVASGGEPVASSGEPVASSGEAFASSGEAVASGGEPVASSGEPVASSGEPVALALYITVTIVYSTK